RDTQRAGRAVDFPHSRPSVRGDMNTLRQKLIDEIEVRGLSRNTKDSYIGYVSRLARHYHRPPDQITDAELRAYLLHLLREKKNGASTVCLAVSALRLFYR